MVILVITLVVVALAGPVAGYFFARRGRTGRPHDSDVRVRQLEDEIRRLRSASAWPGQQAHMKTGPPIPVPPPGPGVSQSGGHAVSPPRQTQAPVQPGPHRPPVQHSPTSYSARSGAERFAQEPPLFGDDVTAGRHVGEPAPQSQVPQISAALPPQPVANPAQQAQDAAPSGAPVAAPGQPAAPVAATTPPAPVPAAITPQPGPDTPVGAEAQTPPTPVLGGDGSPATKTPAQTGFRSVSDLIDDSEAQKLDWLSSLSVGRRVRLQKLGYDVPEKLANLRRAEVRRLARELDVSEEVIRDQWMPAAVEQLKSIGKA
ncbi:MAG: hypothetical protein ACI84D_002403 [Thalassolituus oleivorans]|jgi:hypothetical protein